MIKANELRIGNKLLVDGNIWTIESISNFELYLKENDNYNHLLNAKPIPLTEEILLKCEFDKKRRHKEDLSYGYSIDGIEYINTIDLGKTFFLTAYNEPLIKYVHQLQNIYNFITCGKELEINL